MPLKSKAQQRFMFAAEARGELPKGTAEEWAHHTPDIKALPEHVKDKKKKKSGFLAGFRKKTEEETHPDLPPKGDDKAGWTMGSQEEGAFQKVSEPSLSMEANQQSNWSMGDYVPGTDLRANAETGQFKGKSYRTEGVQNENREMKKSLKQKAQTARGGFHDGGTLQNTVRDGVSKNS